MQPNFNDMIEDISEDDFLDSIEEDDFVFILDREGKLKSFIFPDQYDDHSIPKNVLSILKIFGVDSLDNSTIH